MTIVFEAVLGVMVFGFTSDRLFAEYDLSRGGLMGFGILFMTFVPLQAAFIRRTDVRKSEQTKS